MKTLFGTDGIRGRYGCGFLIDRNIVKLGYAAGIVLRKKYKGVEPKAIIGQDTRCSSGIIFEKLSSGLRQSGIIVVNVGIIPTPAVSHLVEKNKYLAGVVISASHNPWQDNGIKFFTKYGEKLPPKIESEVEKEYFNSKVPLQKKKNSANNAVNYSLQNEYISFLKQTVKDDLSGMKIVLDCANGSTFAIAPGVFADLGAEVLALNTKPDGKNINRNCGSLYPALIQNATVRQGAFCGIAFDGDGDRAVFCDERGNYINGDQIIGGYAIYLKNKKEPNPNNVVVTVMTNLGFMKKMKDEKINVLTTDVGDKYVLEGMKKNGALIGGEQSGHIIFRKYAKTGDGILTALRILSATKETGKRFSRFAGSIKMYPQVMLNVAVPKKIPIENLPGFMKKIKEEENVLAEDGRIFVRYSGTEPLLRIMIEGKSEKKIRKTAEELKKIFLSESASAGSTL